MTKLGFFETAERFNPRILMEKAVCFLSCMLCFDPCIAVALGLNISLQRDKEIHNLCWANRPVWECISLLWPWGVFLFLLRQEHHWAFRHASSFFISDPTGEESGSFACRRKDMYADHYPASILGGVPMAVAAQYPLMKLLLLCLFCLRANFVLCKIWVTCLFLANRVS